MKRLAPVVFTGLTIGALNAALGGCVAYSTASDLDSARTMVRDRAHSSGQRPALNIADPRAVEPEQDDPTVAGLLAEPLTLDNAIRISLLNNRTLRASLLELGVARGQLVQASLFPNPEFEAQVRISQDPAQDPQWDFGLGIDITHILLRGQRAAVAEAAMDAARTRVAGATLDLGFRVRLAYYDVQAWQQQLALQQSVMQTFAASYDTARALSEAGNLPELNLINEQLAYEGSRVMVAETQAELIDARERFNILLGFFGRNTAWTITDPLVDPPATLGDTERLESRAIEASLELAEARAVMSGASRSVALTQTTGLLPDVTVSIHGEHDGTFWELGPALTGRLPVFDRQQGNVLSRQAERDALRERYAATAITIRAAVRAARARAITAQERARMYRDTLLPLRERALQQTVLQYNAMQAGVFQVIQARRDQVDTQRNYLSALRDYWRSRAALEQLLAGRLSGALGAATGMGNSDAGTSSGAPTNPHAITAGH